MRRHAFTPVHAMVVVILLASILSSAAIAQPAPCPAEYPLDPALGTCVDPETGEPVNPSTGQPLTPGGGDPTPTPAPLVELPVGDLASFTVYHLACDDDFDPDAVRDGGGLGPANGCLTYGTPPFTYTISANGVVIVTSTIEAVERNFARFDVPGPIPAGSLTISVAPVADYTTEFVSCGVSIQSGPTDVIEPAIAGGSATFDTLPGQDVECWVYNVTRTPTGDSSLQEVVPGITLVARLCNPGADLTQSDIDAACPTPGNGIDFNVVLSGAPYLISTTNTDGVIDVPLPDGDTTFSITPQVPEGYGLPGYLCVSIQPGGGGGGKVVRLTADAPSHQLNWSSTSATTCTYYFPVIADEGQGVIADPGDVAPTGITISTYYCPAGTVETDDLIAACNQRASGLEFSLLTESETVSTLTSDAAGDVYFANVAPNDYGIALTLPSGYGEPIVVCYHAFANGIVEEGAQDIVFGNQFRFTIFGEGESLECAWYNVPAQGADTGPNIFIEARTCSPGTSITTSMSVFDAQELCPSFYIDLSFQVLNVDQVIATARTNVSFLSPGQVFFTKLPEPASGSFGVVASVREGERTLAVFCDQDFGDGNFQIIPVLVRGDRLDNELGMGAGDTLRCTWFIEMNPLMSGTHAPEAPAQGDAAPAETGDETTVDPGMTVLARLCPPEVVEQQVDLAVACSVPAVGVTFDIAVDGIPSASRTTDETGAIDVPLGDVAATYVINNQPNAGLSEPEVACDITHDDGQIEQVGGYLPAGSTGQEITFDGTSVVNCVFYFLGEVAPVAEDPGDGAADEAAPGDQAAEDGQGSPADQASTEAADAEQIVEDGEAAADVGATGDSEATGDVELGLTVQTLRCPSEVVGADGALDEVCTEPVSDLTFEILVDDVAVGTSVTDATGNLPIPADAGAGMYQFRHEPSPEYLEMRTSCSSVYPNGNTATGSSSASRSQMGTMYLSFDGASQVTCTFYFVQDPANQAPAGEGDAAGAPHTLSLQFWACPEGVDLAADREVLAQACGIESVERSFMLTIDGLTTGETVTGANTWEFQSSPVTVDIGPGIISSAWCDSSSASGEGIAPESPDATTLENGVLKVTVTQPATFVSCDWFIAPA